MVHPYLRRRNHEEAVEYPHACLIPVLERTLGVPLFQEQVMRLAIVAADYTPGEADQLRRDMAAWRRSGRLEQHEHRLISRMESKGIAPEFAARVFKQIQGFGEYGFPESHAASFAIISYASSYLRRHYPAEFTCGLLNAQPMGFYSVATIVEDAKRQGVDMRPVHAQWSAWDCTLEDVTGGASPMFAVRMGLRFVKGFGEKDCVRFLAAREVAPFTSLADVARRTGLSRQALGALAEAGAFEDLGLSRRSALWAVPGAVHDTRMTLALSDVQDMPGPAFLPLDAGDTITWDYRTVSHSVHGHPMAALRPVLEQQGLTDAKRIRGMLQSGATVRYAGLVTHRQRPQTASGVTFMTLEDETGSVNLVVWERVFEKFSVLVRTASLLGVTGTIESKDGVIHVIAQRLWTPPGVKIREPVRSRDFH
jgi:error-prone DNA polymerase